jgi:tetratricopeptide (TPR) repeat protein
MPDPVTRTAGYPAESLIDPTATAAGGGETAVPHAPFFGGRYTLGEEIARGGMGVVYRAADTAFGREVAVKVLSEKFGPASGMARRFADEARITGQLQHPAIPPAHDLGTLPDGRPFLAMKLIRGRTLDALLAERPDPAHDHGRFVAVFEQICQAVAYAHAHHVIHRDLKPSNVMVGNFGEVQVMDWGLAKVLTDRERPDADPGETAAGTAIRSLRDSDSSFTQAGSVLGTPSFMPPEQALGTVNKVDARSDVFGLGAVLAVILTGQPPFVAGSAETTRVKAAQGDVADCFARLDGCGADPELVALCKRCLAPKREDRPADAGQVASAVAELRTAADERARRAELDKVQMEAERASAEARSAERRKRRRLAAAAFALLGLAVVGGLTAVLFVQRRANAELADKQAKVEKRFELAQKAIAKLHTGVGEDMLLRSDQFQGLRTQLLKEAADFYGDLEKLLEGESDAKSRRLLADGYFQLAELTGKIGSQTEALSLHRKALAVRRELAADPGADVEARLDVARSLNAVGRQLNNTGDSEGALLAFAEQHDVAAALDAVSPTEAVLAVLAQSLKSTGIVLGESGKSMEALPAVEKAVAILRKLAGANPNAFELRYDLAKSLTALEHLFWDVGRWGDQMAALEDARAISQKLADDNPADVRYRYVLGNIYNNLGSTLFDMGRPAEALAVLEKGRAIARKLADTHPAVADYQDVLAYFDFNIGRSLSEVGKPAEAMAAYGRALAALKQLAEANPKDTQGQYILGFCYNEIGELLAQTGKPEEALQSYGKARALLLVQAEANRTFRRVSGELASSLEKTGLLLSASGETAKALADCEEALATRQKLCDAQPALHWLRWELAGSHSALGTVQRRAGRPADAAASFRRAIALMEQLPMTTPRNLYLSACCHAQLAGVAAQSGSGLTAEQGAAEAERATATLRKAYARGFGAARLRLDAALDPLRQREDFRKLLADIDAISKGQGAKDNE